MLETCLVPIRQAQEGQPSPLPDNESWADMIRRISDESRPAEIDEKTFYYFEGVLPPKLAHGCWFAFAEGMEPLTIFWQDEGRFFARRLNWNQTSTLYRTLHVAPSAA
jgi:hypothetical protein